MSAAPLLAVTASSPTRAGPRSPLAGANVADAGVPGQIPSPTEDWPPRPDDAMGQRADVYPTERFALAALGRDAANAVTSANAANVAAAAVTPATGTAAPVDGDGLRSVIVYGPRDPDADWQPTLDALRDAIPATVAIDRRAEAAPADRRPADGEAWVVLATRERRSDRPAWSRQPVTRGRVEATVYGRRRSQHVNARWDEKPWADDGVRFASLADPAMTWVVGRAGRPCASRAEAERLALADAAAQMVGRMNPLLPAPASPSVPPVPPGPGLPAVPRAQINRPDNPFGSPAVAPVSARTPRQAEPSGLNYQATLSALTGGQYVRDRSTRRYVRSYGDVWDAAVLVDASPANVAEISRDAARLFRDAEWPAGAQRQERRVTVLSTIAAGGAMMAVIALLYAVVNALTKGYMVRRLRVVAAALLLGGVLLAVAVVA